MRIPGRHTLPLLGVAVVSLILFAILGGSIPSHVDEAPYILAGRAYAGWLLGWPAAVAGGNAGAHWRALNAVYGVNHEHPPVAKTIYGFCSRLFGGLGPLIGPRVGGLFFLLVLQISLYFLIAPHHGRLAATAGALAVIAHPRLVAHAFSCGLDLPVTALSMLCALFFVRGIERRADAVLCGVTWGLAMATKNNGVFLIAPLAVWGFIFHRRRLAGNLLIMAAVGPLTFVAAWPWLWRHPFERVFEYFRFHAQHAVEPSYFLGVVYAVHPWVYPLATLLATMPLTILAFAAAALARLRWRAAGVPPADDTIAAKMASLHKRPPDPTVSLLALLALCALAIVTPPSVPTYNGDRLFLLTVAALCGLAGIGLAAVAERFLNSRKLSASPRLGARFVRAAIVALLGAALLTPGLIGAAATHPFERSYYGALVGFRAGAMRLGFNPMEWSEVPPATVAWLQQNFPGGLNLDRNSGAATALLGLQQIGVLGRQFTFSQHAEYWLLEGNFAYSGFPRYWLLYYDRDPEYHLVRDLSGGGPRVLSLYRR
jgi:hypothetical protein